MTAFTTPQFPASTPQQLASQLWQVPDPNTNTLSGGVSPGPAQPVPQVAPGPGFSTQPAAPQYQQPAQQQPAQYGQIQYPPAQQPAPQTPPPASREQIERMVASGRLSAQEAQAYRSDTQFFDDLYELALSGVTPPQPQPPQQPVQQQPVQQPAQQPGPPPEELARNLLALQQSGAIEFVNGRYISKYPDFQNIAERANTERMRAEQALHELANPTQWIKKNGAEVIDDFLKPLKEEVMQLRRQLQETMPKPHEAWVAKYDASLRVKDAAGNTVELTPVGKVYDQVYRAAQARGIRDPHLLHEAAAQAAEGMMQHMQYVQPAPAPQAPVAPLTYAQAAAQSQLPPNPGFNLPGTQLSRHQPQQGAIPVTNQNTVDFHGLAAGILNGSIPR